MRFFLTVTLQTLCHADGDQHPSLSLETCDEAGKPLMPIQIIALEYQQ